MLRAAMARLLLFALVLSCGGPKGPPAFKVLTFNVLCSFCDTANFDPWNDRVGDIADIVARHDPDVFGLQELFTADEVKQITDKAPGYTAVFFHDPARQYLTDYPDATVFYRPSVFELRESGQYWLSATPDTPWTFGWASGGEVWRLVNWARLLHKPSGRELYFATTHVDNNQPNQDMSAAVILGKTPQTLPVLLVGDFNSTPDTTAYATLTHGVNGAGFAFADAYSLAAVHEVLHNQASEPAYDPTQRIDHVFLGGTWTVSRWRVDLFQYGPQHRYPSDHFAISAWLEIK
jgi:endonuclease/exonuclease/phosphatase family metal-dependent hydrolase